MILLLQVVNENRNWQPGSHNYPEVSVVSIPVFSLSRCRSLMPLYPMA